MNDCQHDRTCNNDIDWKPRLAEAFEPLNNVVLNGGVASKDA